MPLPAVLGALANPWVLSTIGSILPSVVSALTGSPTEDEAKAKVAPQRNEMLKKLMEQGVDQAEAEKLADESIASEVQRSMQSGGIPPWLEGALAVGGGLLGWKAGGWLKGRAGAKAAAGEPAIENAAAGQASAAKAGTPAAVIDESGPTLAGPFPASRGLDDTVRADPAERMIGPTRTGMRTLTPDEMPTADVGPIRSPFAWADEVMDAAPKRDPMAWADDVVSPPSAPYVPRQRPIDPVTGVPRAPRGRVDPTTGAPMDTDEISPVVIDGPFLKRDPLTGGKAYDTGEQRAFAAADRNMQRDAELRRSTMDTVEQMDAAAKPEQIEVMRVADEAQRSRRRPRRRRRPIDDTDPDITGPSSDEP